jgi:hypothetical protein
MIPGRKQYANRACRMAICALVVFAQLVGAFGWAASATIASKRNGPCANRPCGCAVVDAAAHCCCEVPEPVPPPCCQKAKKRSCCDKAEEKPAPVTKPINGKIWLAEMMAPPCQSETPPSTTSSDPEIPPSPLAQQLLAQEPAERLIPSSNQFSAPPLDPPIPPPRLG